MASDDNAGLHQYTKLILKIFIENKYFGGFAQALNLRENSPQTCGEKKGEYADENNGVCDQS